MGIYNRKKFNLSVRCPLKAQFKRLRIRHFWIETDLGSRQFLLDPLANKISASK
jgi:hypothetical protein